MCHIVFPLTTEFFATRVGKGGWQSNCRSCQAAYRKDHYEKNKAKYINKAKIWSLSQRQKVIDYLKDHPCVVCGENDVVVLEFDHRDPSQKSFNMSKKIGVVSWEVLLEEMNKCDVLCANCHRRRTASQFNWYKNAGIA